MMYRWVRRLRRLKHRAGKARANKRNFTGSAFPALELLEDRTVPSTVGLGAASDPLVFHPDFKLIHRAGSMQPLQSSSPVGLVPSQIRHAYGIDQVVFGNGTITGDGTGQTIAIVDAFDDPTITTDLALFDSTLGIAAPPSFAKVAQDGSNNYPGTDPSKQWEVEESLDVEWAHALAPSASILLVEANSANDSDINTAVGTAKNYTGVVVVSMSYGESEFSGETSDDSLYTMPSGHPGVTFVAATGDSGAPGDYPAFSPNVVAAGGTVLSTDSSGDYLGETGWTHGGGGISQYETQPSYQNGIVTQSSTRRCIPDLAFNAGNAVAIADSFTYGSSTPWVAVEGTSISAPSLSAVMAIADQGLLQLGQGSLDGPNTSLPEIYHVQTGDINDITTGNNGFAAGPGYDLVTGRGTPIAPLLVHHLVHIPATDTWTGGGSDSNWSDVANWGGTAPSPGDALVFGSGPSALIGVNDFANGTEFDSITFSGAGYTINGNDITLLNGINGSAATGANTFNLNTMLLYGQSWTGGSGPASLTVGGKINNDGSLLTVSGGSGHPFALGGVISGAGGLTYGGGGTLVLAGSAANTYTGPTAVQSGTLMLGDTGGSAVPGALTIGTSTSPATVRLTASGQTLATAAVTLNSSSTLDLNGNVDGVGALTLTGATVTTGVGTLTVNGTVTDTGASTVSGNLSLPAATTFKVNSSGTLTVQATVGGGGSFTKSGSGTLVLSGANTYFGGSTVAAGTLSVGNASALGNGNLTLDGSTTITASTSGLSLPNTVTVAGNFTLGGSNSLAFAGAATLTGNRTVTVGSGISGTFAGGVGESPSGRSLTKAGSGTLVLPVADSYTGGTALNSGTLTIGDPGALGSGSLTLTSGTLSGTGSTLTPTNNVVLAGSVTLGGSVNITFQGVWTLTGNRTLTVSGTGIMTQGGGIGQSGGTYSFTKSGSGTLVLDNSDTYAGGTKLTAGVLEIGNAGSLGTGTFTWSGGTLEATGSAVSTSNSFVMTGSLTVAGSLDLTMAGSGTLSGNCTLTTTNTGTTSLSGVMAESGGSRSFTKSGSGVLVLSGSNTYSGGTVLSGGTLSLGNASALGSGTFTLRGGTLTAQSALSVTNAITLGGNATIGGSNDLTLSGAVTLTGTRTLTVTSTGMTTLAGAIGQSGGSYGLTKRGSGKLTLSGANTYTGTTTVSGGTLVVNGTQTGSAVSVTSGGTLAGSGSVGAVTVSSGGILAPGTPSGTVILSSGNLSLSSGSAFNVTVAGTAPGTSYDQLSSSGTINLGGSSLNLNLTYPAAVGDSFTIINNTGSGSIVGTFRGLAEGATFVINGMTFQITYKGGSSGNSVVVTRVA
jgi:autotransporter-associated beta strand protein